MYVQPADSDSRGADSGAAFLEHYPSVTRRELETLRQDPARPRTRALGTAVPPATQPQHRRMKPAQLAPPPYRLMILIVTFALVIGGALQAWRWWG